MGFCKICTGRRKPGMHVKIVVNLKKDAVCRQCDKHFEVKLHRRKRDKKLVIFISRLSYSVRPSRRGGTRRLCIPICRESSDSKRESGWLDLEINGGSNMDYVGYIHGNVVNLHMGDIVYGSRCVGFL